MKTKLALSILLLTLFFNFEKGNAQALAWQWAKAAGGWDEDYGNRISTDTSGNVVVEGIFLNSFITFGTITLNNINPGSEDIFIVKYDALGNALWAKSIGEDYDVISGGLATDVNGNVIVTGTFYPDSITIETTTLISAGNRDIFIVKYDAFGNFLWAKSEGGTLDDGSIAVTTDIIGNILVTGLFSSDSITFGTTTLTKTGAYGMYIVKYDSSGNVLWAKSPTGTNYDRWNAVTTDVSENILVTGYFESDSITFGTTTLINVSPGLADIFIVKYDASGNVLWARSGGGTDEDNPTGISTDASENVMLTGSFGTDLTFGTDTLTNVGGGHDDMFVAKFDALGNVLWAKSAGGTGVDVANAISTDGSGNAFTTGNFQSDSITFGTTLLVNAGAPLPDIFIVKYDTSGSVLWAISAGGTHIDGGKGISTDASGNVLVTGVFSNPSIVFGTDTLVSMGVYDFFVAKLSCTTTSTVFPNVCYTYTSPSGNYTWNATGTYTDTIPNAVGCDSIIIINLTINIPDTSITQSGITLTSNATAATYQWLDCDSGYAPISGGTSQIFTPLVDGNYAVAITQNGCTDTSSCYTILGTEINENGYANGFTVIPNPATDYITIKTNSNKKQLITITDITGKIIYGTTTLSDKTIINTKDFPQGVYAVQVQAGDAVQTRKIVVAR